MSQETLSDHLPLSPDHDRERLDALKKLFPDLFSNDGQLNTDELKKLVDPALVSETERYDFRWYGKTKSKREAFTPSRAALVYDPACSVNPDKASGNLIIVDDNLEVLKLLTSAYRERMKCIYIDPPYNIDGDTVYCDDYSQDRMPYWEGTGVMEDGIIVDTNTDSQGRLHSNWLSMIHSRLLVARQLLKKDGVIFVSIDDHEAANLRRVMDEVFGAENFIATFVWNTEGHTDNQFEVKINHEYVMAYARDFEALGLGFVVDPNTRPESNLWRGFAENSITKNGAGNPPSDVILPIGFPCKAAELNLAPSTVQPAFYEAVATAGYISREMTEQHEISYPIRKEQMVAKEAKLVSSCKVFSGWANANKLQTFIDNGCNPIDDEGDKLSFYLSENGVIYYRRDRAKARHILSVLRNMGTTEKMRSELEEMGIYFDYPKPKELLKYLLSVGGCEEQIVLDFFAGSGTTAHAALEMTLSDGIRRTVILVQLPERTKPDSPAFRHGFQKISDITIARVKGVINRIEGETASLLPTEPKRQVADSLGFKVFRLAKSAFPRVEFVPDPAKTEADNIELLKQYIQEKEATFQMTWDRDNIMEEVLLKIGFMLDYTLTRQPEFKKNEVFLAKDAHKESLICLDQPIYPETVDHFKKNRKDFFICLERAFDTTLKWNLKHHLGDKLKAI